jgi:hypothetical protein
MPSSNGCQKLGQWSDTRRQRSVVQASVKAIGVPPRHSDNNIAIQSLRHLNLAEGSRSALLHSVTAIGKAALRGGPDGRPLPTPRGRLQCLCKTSNCPLLEEIVAPIFLLRVRSAKAVFNHPRSRLCSLYRVHLNIFQFERPMDALEANWDLRFGDPAAA